MDQEPSTVLSAAQKTELQHRIDTTLLSNGYITKFDFDLFDHEVSIKVRVVTIDGEVRIHQIIFRGVQALFYQDALKFPASDTPIAAEYVTANVVEWLWMGYEFYEHPVVVRVVDPPPGLEKVNGVRMNFALDLGFSNSVILIAASGVKIDDEDYYVGRPRLPSGPQAQ